VTVRCRCRHEQAEYLEELDGAKVEDPTGKAEVGHAALAPKPKLDNPWGRRSSEWPTEGGQESRSRAGL